jgi:hypothetical protein
MVRLRSFFRIRGEVPPDRRRRRAALLSSAAALGLCTVAGFALFSPGLVFGAGQPVDTATTVEGTVTVGAATADALTASQGTLLVKLPWGAGPGQVGLLAPTEGLARGPEAVAVSPDGRITILDSVNRRLVLLDSAGTFLRSIPVGLTQPRFVAVSGDRLYVLDCDSDRQLVSLDWNGATVGTSALPALDDVVTGLFATDAGPCVEIAHDRTFLVAGSTSLGAAAFGSGGTSKPAQGVFKQLAGRPVDGRFGPVAKVSFKPGKDAQIKMFKLDKSTLKASQTADFASTLYGNRALEHLVSVDGDGRGGLVIGARLLSAGSATSGQPSLVVTRISTSVALAAAASTDLTEPPATDTVLLTDSPFAYLGQPYVVAPDGRVIQPVADETGYSLMVYTFGRAAEVTP